MSEKWTLFVDVEKCTGCQNCFIAVKDEYVGNESPGYFASQPAENATWFTVDHYERGPTPFTQVTYLPRMCQHCDDAPCAKAARDGAVVKRADGIVIIDPQKARGQKQIVGACPYGAVIWNEELQIPQAWPFEAHLLDQGWKRTRVEQVCPTQALKSEKLSDSALAKKTASENWAQLKPEAHSQPRVFYRGLDRINKVFVAGTVEIDRIGVRDCFEGAVAQLSRGGNIVATARTDEFGDFKLDGLTPGGVGVLRIAQGAATIFEQEIGLDQSTSVGAVVFAA